MVIFMTTTDSRLSLLYDVHRVSYLSHELVSQSLAGHDLSGTEFALYSFLVANGPVTVSEVAAGIAAPLATTSKLLARVEKQDHLVRRPNPEDGRSTLVELNAAGRAAHASAGPGFRNALLDVEHELGAAVEDVGWALARLDDALAGALGRPAEAARADATPHRLLSYDGAPLTADEEDETRRFIAWLHWQRQGR